MRLWVSAVCMFAVLGLAMALPVDAKSKDPRKSRAAATADRVQDSPDSYDCIRARGQDPAGNYRHYPCWARAALSGRPGR